MHRARAFGLAAARPERTGVEVDRDVDRRPAVGKYLPRPGDIFEVRLLHVPPRSDRSGMRLEKEHPLPCVRNVVISEHEHVDAAKKLIIDDPFHLVRRKGVAVDSERFRHRQHMPLLVRHGRSVAGERSLAAGVGIGFGEELPPDDVNPRHVHRPERTQKSAVAVARRPLRNVLAVEMSAGPEFVGVVPILDRFHEALHEKIGHHVEIVDALFGDFRVERMLGVENALGERRDVVAFPALELLVEIGRPAEIRAVMVLRHGRLVHEGELHRLAEMVADVFFVLPVRAADKIIRGALFDNRRIVAAARSIGSGTKRERLLAVTVAEKAFFEPPLPVGGGDLPAGSA